MQCELRECVGLQSKALVQFSIIEFGSVILCQNSAIGFSKTDKNGTICNFFGCNEESGLVIRLRNTKRCQDCSRLENFVRTRMKRRRNRIVEKSLTLHEKMRDKVKTLQLEIRTMQKELRTMGELVDENYIGLNCNAEVDDKDTYSLVRLLMKVLEANKTFNSNCFMFKLIRQQLLCLTKEDGRGFRWDPSIIQWALTLQYHGGKGLLNILRGNAFAGQQRHGNLRIDSTHWNLFLPSNSILRKYLPIVDPYDDISDNHCETIVDLFESSKDPKRGGILFDEIELSQLRNQIEEELSQLQDQIEQMESCIGIVENENMVEGTHELSEELFMQGSEHDYQQGDVIMQQLLR